MRILITIDNDTKEINMEREVIEYPIELGILEKNTVSDDLWLIGHLGCKYMQKLIKDNF